MTDKNSKLTEESQRGGVGTAALPGTTKTAKTDANDRFAEQASTSPNAQFGDDTGDRRQVLTELGLARVNNRPMTDYGIVVLRVSTLLMFIHGITKLAGFGAFRDTVAQTSIGALAPDLVALLQIAAEVALPIALVGGLLTRLSGLLLGINMGVVWLAVHLLPKLSTPLTPLGGLQGESALLFAFVGLALSLTGGGRFSLDHMVTGKRQRDRAEHRAEERA